MNDELYQWACNVGLQIMILQALADHKDMDQAYYRGMVDEMVKNMPASLVNFLHTFMDSPAGEQYMKDLQFWSMVRPYTPEGQARYTGLEDNQ